MFGLIRGTHIPKRAVALKQKGAIFGFGSTTADDTGTVLKICEVVDPAEKQLLLKSPLHNLGEEQNVGLLNYEIGFRGHKHLETVSQKMVQSKSNDLTRGKSGELKRFRKQASDIKQLKYQWTKKMEALQKKGLSIQEVECLVLEKKKLEEKKNQHEVSWYINNKKTLTEVGDCVLS